MCLGVRIHAQRYLLVSILTVAVVGSLQAVHVSKLKVHDDPSSPSNSLLFSLFITAGLGTTISFEEDAETNDVDFSFSIDVALEFCFVLVAGFRSKCSLLIFVGTE